MSALFWKDPDTLGPPPSGDLQMAGVVQPVSVFLLWVPQVSTIVSRVA